MEENLDVGKIVGTSLRGSSGWSSQYEMKTESGEKYFVKTARGSSETMFKGEALGLQAMYGQYNSDLLTLHACLFENSSTVQTLLGNAYTQRAL